MGEKTILIVDDHGALRYILSFDLQKKGFKTVTAGSGEKGIEITENCLEMMNLIIPNLKINKEACKKAMTKELFATEEVYKLVKKGKSFRDAYKEVKKSLK